MPLSDIFDGFDLSPAELEKIATNFKKISYEKGDIILDAGSTVKYQYYVLSGCLRTFFIDGKDKEHTLQFAIKDWWVSDYTAYFSSGKAIMTIECLQDATVYRIPRLQTEALCRDMPKLETFFRKKIEGGFATLQMRILSNLADSAEDRYLSFLKDYPEIERNVKNYHIASYLGITTESLSRIRKELAKK
jgi:CRP-like cAMP-binding protein